MARLPPPCHPLYCRLRLFDRRTRRHPPLRTTFLLAALGICHSRGLPTQRRCRSDPNGTSPTRSQQSEGASSSRSPRPFRDALAAIRRSARRKKFPITDAVRLVSVVLDIRLAQVLADCLHNWASAPMLATLRNSDRR